MMMGRTISTSLSFKPSYDHMIAIPRDPGYFSALRAIHGAQGPIGEGRREGDPRGTEMIISGPVGKEGGRDSSTGQEMIISCPVGEEGGKERRGG